MTKEIKELIKIIANSDLTEDEIAKAIYVERRNEKEIKEAREDLINSFCRYLKTFLPDCDITESDIKFLNEQFAILEDELKEAADLIRKTTKAEKKTNVKEDKSNAGRRTISDKAFEQFFKELGL